MILWQNLGESRMHAAMVRPQPTIPMSSVTLFLQSFESCEEVYLTKKTLPDSTIFKSRV